MARLPGSASLATVAFACPATLRVCKTYAAEYLVALGLDPATAEHVDIVRAEFNALLRRADDLADAVLDSPRSD